MIIVTGENGEKLYNEYQAYLVELNRLNGLINHSRGKKQQGYIDQKAALVEPKPVYSAVDLVERATKAVKRQVEYLENEIKTDVEKMPTNQELLRYFEQNLNLMVECVAELQVFQIVLRVLDEMSWREAVAYIKRVANRNVENFIDISHADDAQRLLCGARLRNWAAVLFYGNIPMQLKLLLEVESMDVYVYEP